MKYVSILGSTGSIGTQTLDIAKENPDKIKIVGLSSNRNIDLLEQQISIFKPSMVAVMNEEKASELRKRIGNSTEVVSGIEGLCAVASLSEANIILTAVTGMIGLEPTLRAIERGKDIALANKETLVAGGHLVMAKAKEKGIKIYPVDSEHSAIFQCLMGNDRKDLHKIILTASGGPFRGYSLENLKDVTLEKALKHPNWSMGRKITIDSATLMNKGFEVIEAKWLFDLNKEQIEVVVHPQSIVHSLVEFKDHSTIAQMGYPDMKVPIQLALFYPNRIENSIESLNLAQIGTLTFEKPDINVFRCLGLSYESIKIGGSMPTVLNAANEIAVDAFLNRKIHFTEIPQILEKIMNEHNIIQNPDLDSVLEVDRWARAKASSKI
ncbi:1-deoxy-D-xylulose 5-phosphate reductoisomerase [Alkalibaculum bacchi]|uniref:1-deoxy-D-xylulose 5-phosphate reductoisomerase n=1 Tax=Alkalibaculum bacchi TaxID=645887 RepID=A0A366I6W0_9FIRM|nr:1-deoxy-D-xylulose-5-phosphate reductoisomerase [Alkalibaculum bacchi]RBP64457.1 1-deoxy-D-xylulose 5-phosphate reductoisomerase [Alkalibaculum bacchi]